ncbi:MAG: hypothetical protein EZS28_028109 [Streblomastix strix]|uniref:Uncharacterized protein n=1 Tax=Streblomastix strix TaxID=222440 RepID=A0A5J4V2T6_9EUKA|nr:MAG: hypothetical protein EZS28_028109 [Streblomastix strix]
MRDQRNELQSPSSTNQRITFPSVSSSAFYAACYTQPVQLTSNVHPVIVLIVGLLFQLTVTDAREVIDTGSNKVTGPSSNIKKERQKGLITESG